MNPRAGRPVLLAFAAGGLLIGSAVVSGCAGRDRYYSSAPDGRIPRVVRRPTYDEAGAVRPMFLGGYAGADYSREGRQRP